MRTSISGMTAVMIMAAREVEGMYWKRELRTASARSTTLPNINRDKSICSPVNALTSYGKYIYTLSLQHQGMSTDPPSGPR